MSNLATTPPTTAAGTRTKSTALGWVAIAMTCLLGVVGSSFIAVEAVMGPTVDGGGYEQDHGGYVVGLPIVVAAAIAAACLLIARRAHADRADRLTLEVFALLALSVPFILAGVGVAIGVLDLSSL